MNAIKAGAGGERGAVPLPDNISEKAAVTVLCAGCGRLSPDQASLGRPCRAWCSRSSQEEEHRSGAGAEGQGTRGHRFLRRGQFREE